MGKVKQYEEEGKLLKPNTYFINRKGCNSSCSRVRNFSKSPLWLGEEI